MQPRYNLRVTNSDGDVYLMESEATLTDANTGARNLKAAAAGDTIRVDIIAAGLYWNCDFCGALCRDDDHAHDAPFCREHGHMRRAYGAQF